VCEPKQTHIVGAHGRKKGRGDGGTRKYLQGGACAFRKKVSTGIEGGQKKQNWSVRTSEEHVKKMKKRRDEGDFGDSSGVWEAGLDAQHWVDREGEWKKG